MKNDNPLIIKYTVATLGRLFLCLIPMNSSNKNIDSNDGVDDSDLEILENETK